MSLEQRAQIKLKKIMKLNRQVTSVQLADYLERHLGDSTAVTSDAMAIHSIHDFCVFVHLARLSLFTRNHPNVRLKAHPMMRELMNYRFESASGEWTDNDYLRVPRFRVIRRHTGANHAA